MSRVGSRQVDVAVVGAGIGGCYVAYRLLGGVAPGQRPGRTVALYERSSRIGGRLWSIQTPLLPDAVLELGGMRFHSAEHHVTALVRHLGLDTRVIPFESWRPENIVYVRGVRLTARELRDPRSAPRLPFGVQPHERGLDEEGLTLAAVEVALPGFTGLRRRYHRVRAAQDWGQARDIRSSFLRRLDTLRLRDIPWSQVVDNGLSTGAAALLRAMDGYDGYTTNGNAADWIHSIFQEAPEAGYLTLAGGMQSLALGVHAGFTAAGGRTFLQHELRRIERADPGAFELRFRVGRARGRERIIRAAALVLALPQQAVQALDLASAFLTPAARADVDAVQGVPAFKLFLGYSFPWWRGAGIRAGRSTTDLPLRQVRYLSCDPARPGLIMAAYPAGPSVERWEAFRSGPRFGQPCSGAGPDDEQTRPSTAMVEYAHRLLKEMHGMTGAPDPLAATWFDWSGPAHRAGWHVWRPGRGSREVTERLARAARMPGIHLVSDCWTESPGSVQGTLSAAESVLQSHLGCAPADWLPKGAVNHNVLCAQQKGCGGPHRWYTAYRETTRENLRRKLACRRSQPGECESRLCGSRSHGKRLR
jgi:monoamine oxidase